ncbi:hypothetical protein PVK06_042964 [Gossypium arboreum]|uniref:Aminotransferase-like plant mobile domain-containing protein n=1 Tax=Gossypium arboreum TaxID=29729 RepID=A0ABR0MP93_GOSAR|nr:hypothetical protein PVK06_042964 [Gossypium arboreum]
MIVQVNGLPQATPMVEVAEAAPGWDMAKEEGERVTATEEELICVARAYIMYIIGGVLMPDANNNRVHLQYLPLLAYLRNVRSYSWGSAILAILYRELCRKTKPDAVDIGGCLVLLQSWAIYQMSFLASQPRAYESVADIEAELEPNPEPEPKPEP